MSRVHLAFIFIVLVLSSGCVSNQTHREALRDLEDTRIELAKVESREILRSREARQLRAQVNTLKANRRVLERENRQLKKQRLQPAQRNALETLETLNARRRRAMNVLRTNLEQHIKDNHIGISWSNGHPTLTFAQSSLFDAKATQLKKGPLWSDLLLALKSSGATGAIVSCAIKPEDRNAYTLCQKRLQAMNTQNQSTKMNLYLHNAVQVSTAQKDSKRAKDQDINYSGAFTVLVLTDLSPLDRP